MTGTDGSFPMNDTTGGKAWAQASGHAAAQAGPARERAHSPPSPHARPARRAGRATGQAGRLVVGAEQLGGLGCPVGEDDLGAGALD